MKELIPLAGVIGMPIAHSRSPQIHGAWLKRYEIVGHYIPMAVEPTELGDVLRTLPKAGFVGVNVTIPHKEAALQIADHCTARAHHIGAANTLIFKPDGTILADNTDGYGFIANLQANIPSWHASHGPALVLGAGGASRAIIASLLEAGAPEIILTNRTQKRADALADEFGAKVKTTDWHCRDRLVANAALIVNTTSLGMLGQDPLRLDLGSVDPNCVVTDLVYNPLQTDLLKAAKMAGAVAVDGLGMLLHQAVPGFEAWFGIKPEVDESLRELVLK